MKKKIIAVSAILIAACGLIAGCSLSPEGPKQEDKCAHLDEMAHARYSKIELRITTQLGKDTLESAFTFTYGDAVTIAYTVEEVLEIDPADPAAELKTVKRGTATISGGSVTVEGDDAGITAQSAELPFTFREAYFENAEYGGNFFSADVKEPSSFLKGASSCTNMRAELNFGTSFTSLKVTYEGALGENVCAAYTFTA